MADTGNNTIRKIVIATGAVTTLAGSGWAGFADGVGAAATFHAPRKITTDGTSLYVVDTLNYAVRKIVIAIGAVTTLAGSGAAGNPAMDGTGTAASFNSPSCIYNNGRSLHVMDYNSGFVNNRLVTIQ